MVRGHRLIPVLSFFLILLLCFSSLADEIITYDTEQNAISINYHNCSPGSACMLFLIKDSATITSLNSKDVYFMDQLTADGSGNISVLYVAPEFSSCQVGLGGTFKDSAASPRVIGFFNSDTTMNIMRMPSALQQIEESAFEGGNFTHVYLSGQVHSIQAKAFAGCEKLVYIEIPASVTFIDDSAFQGSPNVTIGCTAGSEAYNYAVRLGINWRLLDE